MDCGRGFLKVRCVQINAILEKATTSDAFDTILRYPIRSGGLPFGYFVPYYRNGIKSRLGKNC